MAFVQSACHCRSLSTCCLLSQSWLALILCLIVGCVWCPDKAEREADGDSTQGNAVQIEEVSQAEAEAAQAVEGQQAGPSSPHKTDSIGLMQSVVDAARSLLSSKPDEVGSRCMLCCKLQLLWQACFARKSCV